MDVTAKILESAVHHLKRGGYVQGGRWGELLRGFIEGGGGNVERGLGNLLKGAGGL